MNSPEEIADASEVIHGGTLAHMWGERHDCPLCQEDIAASAAWTGSVEENIADIEEVLNPPCYHESGRDDNGKCLDCGK